MNHPNPSHGSTALKSATVLQVMRRAALATFILIGAAAFVVPVRAQVTQLAVFPIDTSTADAQNLYAGASFSGIYSNIQIRVVLPGSNMDPINLSALNPPVGATVFFPTNSFTNSQTIMLTVAVTNVAKGVYPLFIQASNTVSSATISSNLVNLIVGQLWTAPTNAPDLNWSSTGNWSTGVAPTTGDDVMFLDSGTNINVADGSISLSSLAYIRSQNGGTHTTIMTPGTTVSVTGTNGFSVNTDSIIGNNKTTTVFIQGTNASLVVSNVNANFAVNAQNSGGSGTTLNMQVLDNFSATVKQFGFCDVNLANQGAIGNQIGVLTFARTNVVKGLFATDYSQVFMTNAITFFNNGDIGNNGSASTVNMGISNAFLADSIRISLSRVGAAGNQVRFNPVFLATNPVAVFRNTNGGRMTLLGIAVDSGVNNSGNNSQGTLDFRGGTADVLVDTIWVGRFRSNSATAGGSARGVIFLQNGLIDANNLILGYQAFTNEAFCRGTLNVVGPGTFRVNNNIELGHTTGSTNIVNAATGNGIISVSSNGTVSASSIILGELSGGTAGNGNNITLNTGGRLIVSNTIASPAKWLNSLTMNSSARLVLHIDGNNTSPYVYATNLTVNAGQNDVLQIATIQNLTIPPGGTNIPMFLFGGTGGANFAQVVMPPGLIGGLVPDGVVPNQIDLTILANTPKNLVWRGYVNNNWDVTTTNWLDLDTLFPTNYVNGDNVAFDDAGGIPTTINLALPILIPSSITMSNTANAYTINGGGGLQGSATLIKNGANSLTVDANTAIAVQINQGLFSGVGTVGSAVIASNATINFAGTITAGLSCAGSGTVSGNVGGSLLLQGPSGTLTNAGTINGSLSFQSGTLLYNSGLLDNFGTATVSGGARLINNGNIGAQLETATLSVNGTLEDTGVGTIYLTQLAINGGGRFVPGGSGVGTTAIFSPGVGTSPGRVTFGANSTNVFRVDFGTAQTNTVVTSQRQDFGPNQNTKSFNGCTLQIVNIGSTPFAAGQQFRMFHNSDINVPNLNIGDSGLNTTNSYPLVDPAVPGPGLAWDLSALREPNADGLNGFVRIIGVNTTPTNLNLNITFNTQISTNGAGSTNAVIIAHLNWPDDHKGWRVQQQQNGLPVGLANNWAEIFGSGWTNELFLTNNVNSGTVFYRMIFP